MVTTSRLSRTLFSACEAIHRRELKREKWSNAYLGLKIILGFLFMISYFFLLDILFPFVLGVTFNIENKIVDDNNSNSACSALFLLFFIHFDGGFIFLLFLMMSLVYEYYYNKRIGQYETTYICWHTKFEKCHNICSRNPSQNHRHHRIETILCQDCLDLKWANWIVHSSNNNSTKPKTFNLNHNTMMSKSYTNSMTYKMQIVHVVN